MSPGNDIELRAARPDDAAAVVALIREGFEPRLFEADDLRLRRACRLTSAC